MVGIAFVQPQNQATKRKAAAQKKKESRQMIADTLAKWDTSGSGALNFEELRSWLTDIAHGEAKATDDEVRWVQTMANGGKAGAAGGSVLPENFTAAAQAWIAYRHSLQEIEAMFTKFDKDHSSYLDNVQLGELLTALNEGETIPESQVEWVLSSADVLGNGVITPPVLNKALSLWYSRHEDEPLPAISKPVPMDTKAVIKVLSSKKANQSSRRKEVTKKKADNRKFIKETLAKWDTNKSGGLSFAQFQDWLSEISAGDGATEDEVKWVQGMVQKDKIAVDEFADKEALFSSSILPEDFLAAVDAWMSYKESKEEIDAIFAKHDTDGSDSLDRTQLIALLTELNGGVAPEDAEIDWVLHSADQFGDGVIAKPELKKALGLWFSRAEHHDDILSSGDVVSDPIKAAHEASFKNNPHHAPAQAPTKADAHQASLDELKTIPRSTQAAKRKEVARVRDAQQKFIRETLAKWDKDGTGTLSFSELKDWLSASSPGGPATDEETRWIAAIANMDKIADMASTANASVLPKDFVQAATAWMTYKESKDEISAMFDKYATDKSGALGTEQLGQLLSSLNSDVKPTPEEVAWVFAHAGQIGDGRIDKPELCAAISLWYAHVDDETTGKADVTAANTPIAAPAKVVPAGEPHLPQERFVAAVKSTPACGGCSVQ